MRGVSLLCVFIKAHVTGFTCNITGFWSERQTDRLVRSVCESRCWRRSLDKRLIEKSYPTIYIEILGNVRIQDYELLQNIELAEYLLKKKWIPDANH